MKETDSARPFKEGKSEFYQLQMKTPNELSFCYKGYKYKNAQCNPCTLDWERQKNSIRLINFDKYGFEFLKKPNIGCLHLQEMKFARPFEMSALNEEIKNSLLFKLMLL